MFTGIIEHLGTIESLSVAPNGGRVTIQAPTLAGKLSVANSIAVNGCCLTIISTDRDRFSADLSAETIAKTSFGASSFALRKSDPVNLEQPVTAGKEFGGHFVLGHVDNFGRVAHLLPEGESWWYSIEIPSEFAPHIVDKGSITIDGISLTIARSQQNLIEIAVIPYTYEHTNIRHRKSGDIVNLEFDILGKYVERYFNARKATTAPSPTVAQLVEQGF